MSLRLGVVAKSVEQANHWLETCQLHQLSDWDYQTFVWPADTSATSLDTRLHGLIWLWEQVHSGEAEKEQERWRSFLAACLTCFPKAVPIIIVASGDVTQAGKAQLREMVKQLRKAYVRSWHGWMPVEFADRSRITMQVKDAAGALRLLQHFSELKRDLQRWQEKAHVQAERCLTLGVLLTTVYLALLAATLFWKSTPSADRSSDPLVWVKKDWQYHLTDVRQMLSQMGNKSLQELTAPELQRFNQHLRWLPVSLDMLKQRRPTRELLYYRASVEEVLQSMEKIITDWTQNRTKTPLEWTAEQLLLAQVLDSVFEPRPAPTAIHLAAQRYWLQERQLTVLLLKSSPATSPGALLSLLQQRKIACDNVRVHAPELKEAWEQELSMNIQVLENMVAQPAKPRQEFTLPELLLEAGVKPD